MEKILFVGAVGGMSYSVKRAKELGYRTFCIDYYADSQAKDYADVSMLESTTNTEAIVKIVKENDIDGIFTGFSDNNIRSAALVCENVGLPCYTDFKQIEILQNKKEFRKLCIEYGIKCPKEYSDIQKIRFPVIVKPSDAYAAKGITVCHDRNTLDEAIDKAKAASRNGEVIIEDYISGSEVMVHFVMIDGKLKLSSILDRKLAVSFSKNSKPLAPVVIENSDKYYNSVVQNEKGLENLFKALGYRNIVGFLQGIANDNEVYFFEPAIRFGGNLSELFNYYCHGVDVVGAFLKGSISGDFSDLDISKVNPLFDKKCYNITLFAKEGTIKCANGEDETYEIESVKDLQRYYHIGKCITDDIRYTYEAIAYRIIMIADSKEKIIDDLHHLEKVLTLVDDEGNNLLDWTSVYKNM